jgi:hypothetical protein
MVRRPCMGRPVPRHLWRNALFDVTTLVPTTVYHRRSYAKRYSRSMLEPMCMGVGTASPWWWRANAHASVLCLVHWSNGPCVSSRPTPPILRGRPIGRMADNSPRIVRIWRASVAGAYRDQVSLSSGIRRLSGTHEQQCHGTERHARQPSSPWTTV